MSPIQIIEDYQALLWQKKDLVAVDKYMTETTQFHSVIKTITGITEIKNLLSGWLQAFPDIEVFWDDIICSGNKVVSQWHSKATHQGTLLGVDATDCPVAYPGVTIYQLDGDKICDYWSYIDMQNLLQQIT